MRDCFALCALMYEAIKNENKAPADYEVFMTRQQTCTSFMDFDGVYTRDLVKAQQMVDDEVAFFERRIDDLECDPLLKQTMKALLPVPKLTRIKGVVQTTNIFSAARIFFEDDFQTVVNHVNTLYADYCHRAATRIRELPLESTELLQKAFSVSFL